MDEEDHSSQTAVRNTNQITTPLPTTTVINTSVVKIVRIKTDRTSRKSQKENPRKPENLKNTISEPPTLHYTSGWNSTQRTTCQFLSELEKPNTSSMTLVRYRPRIQTTIPIKVNPLEAETNTLISDRPDGGRRSGREIQDSTCNRKVTNSGKGLPLSILYYNRTKQDTPYPRFSTNKSIFAMLTLQDGRSLGTQRTAKRKRLYSENRFKEHIRGSSDPPRFSEIPIFTLWPENLPTIFLQTDEICPRAITQREYQTHTTWMIYA